MYENINVLMGKTLTNVEAGDEHISFTTIDGEKYQMSHTQDCCESVFVDDINGDLQDLVGTPILLAEEVSNDFPAKDKYDESFTWTFYRLATIKGYVNIKWYGTSNGYYSEGVDFIKIA